MWVLDLFADRLELVEIDAVVAVLVQAVLPSLERVPILLPQQLAEELRAVVRPRLQLCEGHETAFVVIERVPETFLFFYLRIGRMAVSSKRQVSKKKDFGEV